MHRPKHRVNMAVEIDLDTYNRVSAKLHQGQLSQIMRRFMHELDIILGDDPSELSMWLYSGAGLHLPGRKQI